MSFPLPGGSVSGLAVLHFGIGVCSLGLLMGGSVICWFTGTSMQAVVTGAYRAVVYIKRHMRLDAATASVRDSILLVGLWFVYRSFFFMRIPEDLADDAAVKAEMKGF